MSQDEAIVAYSEMPDDTWNRFVKGSKHGWVTDLSDWMRFFEDECGYENHSFAIVVEGCVRLTFSLFLAPNLLAGKRLVSGPFFDHGGPVVEAGWERLIRPAEEHILALAKRKKVRLAEIRDARVPLSQGIERDDYCNFLFELGRPEEEMFSGLNENVRRAVRKSRKACSAVISRDPEDLAAVWKLYEATMLSHGTPPWGRRFFGAFSRELRKDRARVIMAIHEGELLGGALFWGNGRTARLEISACPSEEARKLQVNSLLFWQSVLAADDLGYQSIELSRTLKGSPHYDFKKRWGAQETPLTFTYLGTDRPPRDPRESVLVHLASLGRYVPSVIMTRLGDRLRIRLAM